MDNSYLLLILVKCHINLGEFIQWYCDKDFESTYENYLYNWRWLGDRKMKRIEFNFLVSSLLRYDEIHLDDIDL